MALAEAVGDALGALVGETNRFVVDLIGVSAGLFSWDSPDIAGLVDAAAHVDFLVVASPTYKAAYTGLLKAFLDRFETNGLEGVVAVPVMTGGSPHHSLAPDTTLRPLLVELGASVPTTSLYFVTADSSAVAPVVSEWTRANRAAILGAAHARRGEPPS